MGVISIVLVASILCDLMEAIERRVNERRSRINVHRVRRYKFD